MPVRAADRRHAILARVAEEQTIHVGDLPTSIQTWRQQTQAAVEAAAAPAIRSIMPICEMEKQAILGAIEQLHGDKLEAARLLGIGKTTLWLAAFAW